VVLKMKTKISLFILILFPFLLYSFGPNFAGSFYLQDKNELIKFVDSALKEGEKYFIKDIKKEEIKAVLVPHAGYNFSGKIAGISYASILDNYETIIILGTAHTMPIKGAALIMENYRTPIGEVEIDRELAKNLLKRSNLFEENIKAYLNEHSIEVQLPFLQRKIKNKFKILPLILNTDDLKILSEIGKILAETIKNKKTLLVISSDLSHYPDYNDANLVDKTLLLSIEKIDANYFALAENLIMNKSIENLSTVACGSAAIKAAIFALNNLGVNKFLNLKYANSYDTGGIYADKNRVVGYSAGIFISEKNKKEFSFNLNEKEKKELLKIARDTIKKVFDGDKNIFTNTLSENFKFNLPAAVFVTLTINKNLRGCIGSIEPHMTLRDAVISSAYSAAFRDSRFLPLTKEEFDKIKIEISILSPLRKVSGYKDIQKGMGVVLSSGYRSGLFLPQVWEQIPDKELFLTELCSQKAGLKETCWKDKEVDFFVFDVEKFEEGENL